MDVDDEVEVVLVVEVADEVGFGVEECLGVIILVFAAFLDCFGAFSCGAPVAAFEVLWLLLSVVLHLLAVEVEVAIVGPAGVTGVVADEADEELDWRCFGGTPVVVGVTATEADVNVGETTEGEKETVFFNSVSPGSACFNTN